MNGVLTVQHSTNGPGLRSRLNLCLVFIATSTMSFSSVLALRASRRISIVHVPFVGRSVSLRAALYMHRLLHVFAQGPHPTRLTLLHPKPLIADVVANQTHRIRPVANVLRRWGRVEAECRTSFEGNFGWGIRA